MSESDEGSGRRKSDIKFLHDKRNVSISNGLKVVHEEYVIDGPKGLMIKFYHKEGDNFYKVTIKALDDGNYKFISSRNDEDKREDVLSKKDLISELAKSKMLKFALDYLEKQKGGAGSRNGSRGSGRNGSRGSGRNGSRGSGRNGSRGSGRNGSRGSSRNQSRDNFNRNGSRGNNRSRNYME